MLEIFLDMDGVLADLRRHLHDSWHKDGHPFVDDASFARWHAGKDRWISGPILNPEFWEMIPPYPWTQSLYAHACMLGSVRICSNPGRAEFSHAAAYGKMAWCQERLHVKPGRVILLRDKYLLARGNRILIDDDEENIQKWREAGGIGVLFPQPWNDARQFVSDDPVGYCIKEISRHAT